MTAGPSSSAKESYEQIWPAVARRLRTALAASGVGSTFLDDVVQETAARLWERWERLDRESDLFPLALTIARHLVIDKAREQRKVELCAAIEPGHVADPAESLWARLELHRVLRALMSMTPRYRDLLLAEAGWSADTRSEAGGVATNMARMRARRRLRGILERAGAAVSLPLLRARAWLSRHNPFAGTQSGSDALLATVQVAIIWLFATAGGVVGGGAIAGPENEHRSTRLVSAVDRISRSHVTNEIHRRGIARVQPPHKEARSDVPGAATPGLIPEGVPRVKGHSGDGGSFGVWGYSDRNEGNANLNGEELRWEQEHYYRNPRCVRRAAHGTVSTDCSGGRAPNGYVSIEYGGERTRVEYGD